MSKRGDEHVPTERGKEQEWRLQIISRLVWLSSSACWPFCQSRFGQNVQVRVLRRRGTSCFFFSNVRGRSSLGFVSPDHFNHKSQRTFVWSTNMESETWSLEENGPNLDPHNVRFHVCGRVTTTSPTTRPYIRSERIRDRALGVANVPLDRGQEFIFNQRSIVF